MVIKAMGGCCTVCKIDDVRVLEIDHKFGDGAKERSLFSGDEYYRHILRNLYTGRYDLLCANHHRIKTHEHLEHGRRFDLDDLSDGELMQLQMNGVTNDD
jgi:hypothetical protein